MSSALISSILLIVRTKIRSRKFLSWFIRKCHRAWPGHLTPNLLCLGSNARGRLEEAVCLFFFLLFPHCFCPAPGWSHDIQAGCRRSSPWQTAEDSPFWRGLASSARSLKFFQARIDRQAQFNSSCNNNNRESSLCAADPRGEVENCPRNKRDSVRSK